MHTSDLGEAHQKGQNQGIAGIYHLFKHDSPVSNCGQMMTDACV